ncbi:MAG: tRNA 4-thiouridine(8) synthase ThiI [Oscillospiraceae bacterium]|nr:tRNA 4-thiouridine(8) synthase ThiI [Oscillospiraceae bacterium]
MKELIIFKEGEIALKGLNKRSFEDAFIHNLKHRLKKFGKFTYEKSQSTIYAIPQSDDIDLEQVLEIGSKVFGAAALCKAAVLEKDFDIICKSTVEYIRETAEMSRTFKVEAKRSDKSFPLKSPEICAELGGKIIEAYPHLTVDVKNPQMTVTVEIRDTSAYIHGGNLKGAGGIPVGTSGSAMLLLSGGIDSPVAAYMMAKRGVRLSAIHYVSPPYTSERARLKVERLCEKLTPYCGDVAFYCVPFTKIQEAIRDNCPEELFTIIMRRIMMEIAQRIAAEKDIQALVTGESVGQVASQTMGAIVCTDAVCRMPVFRPVIGMDKTEIVEIARKIDTFDISIEPYEDCCTVFTPKHPKTRPVPADVEAAQNAFDFEPLIAGAVKNTELKVIKLY